MEKALAEEVGIHDFPAEPYFVDFLRDAPELTGDEPEETDPEAPKVYEEVKKKNKKASKLSRIYCLRNILKPHTSSCVLCDVWSSFGVV